MKLNESIADVFLMALKSMPKDPKDAVIARIATDTEFSQAIQDLMVFDNRKDEPVRPFHEYIAQRKA